MGKSPSGRTHDGNFCFPIQPRELYTVFTTKIVEGFSKHSAGGFSRTHWNLRIVSISSHAVQQKIETEIDVQLVKNN